jgi:hypothetical protein
MGHRKTQPVAAAAVVLMAGVAFAIMRSGPPHQPEDKWEAAIAQLPKVNGKLLFEGDILLSRADLVRLLVERERKSSREAINQLLRSQGIREQSWPDTSRDPIPKIQIKVDLENNRLDIYPPGRRALTYGIYRDDFTSAEYDIMVKALAEATQDWQNACPSCGISFSHSEASDREQAPARASFVVRKSEGQDYLAYSFFPNAPSRDKVLMVYPKFFDSRYNQAGILRHELGHSLGYVHEFNEEKAASTKCSWDGRQFRLVTPYDSQSVMNFCAGDPKQDTALPLTSTDLFGHRLVYSLSQ